MIGRRCEVCQWLYIGRLLTVHKQVNKDDLAAQSVRGYLPAVLRIRIRSDPVFLGHPDPENTRSGSFIHKKTPVKL